MPAAQAEANAGTAGVLDCQGPGDVWAVAGVLGGDGLPMGRAVVSSRSWLARGFLARLCAHARLSRWARRFPHCGCIAAGRVCLLRMVVGAVGQAVHTAHRGPVGKGGPGHGWAGLSVGRRATPARNPMATQVSRGAGVVPVQPRRPPPARMGAGGVVLAQRSPVAGGRSAAERVALRLHGYERQHLGMDEQPLQPGPAAVSRGEGRVVGV